MVNRLEIRFPLVEERDTAIRACERLTKERDEARAELVRLRAYNGAADIPGGSIRGAWELMKRMRDYYDGELLEARAVAGELFGYLHEMRCGHLDVDRLLAANRRIRPSVRRLLEK